MINKNRLNAIKIIIVAEDTVLYESPYLGQHGISILLIAEAGGATKKFLVDVGQNPTALLENMSKMDISPSHIDAIVLTHCHYDHTQGVARILKEIGKSDIPVIAHPDLFRLNFITDPHFRHLGIMDGDKEADIETSGGKLCLTKDPIQILPGLITTGEVKRQTDFEEVGMDLFTIKNGKIETDLMTDDISVVANLKEKGLVVVTGCSHAGIVNIIKHAIKLTGTKKVHGIIGGFHLIEASTNRIKKTVQELERLNPDWIAAGHCTGFEAQVELYNTFKDRFSPLHTGMIFEI
ncbi:MAG: MBL fold metallo-hydrolase [Thermodesulfobacteriota bacterium]|nr:MBL fold metallo-hydrolase [Thermodesulfobacteriota bacterium]